MCCNIRIKCRIFSFATITTIGLQILYKYRVTTSRTSPSHLILLVLLAVVAVVVVVVVVVFHISCSVFDP
jgi:hypothetical protein